MFKRRDYQIEAIKGLKNTIKRYPKCNPLLVLPTGAGKTIVTADIIHEVRKSGYRVIVLARTKELIQQNRDKFCQAFPEHCNDAGAYCAGLGERDASADILFASIQSVAKRADEIGPRELVIIDEAHQVPVNEDSQYQTFFAALERLNKQYGRPAPKRIGLTASPYRLDGGLIFGGPESQFDRVAYNVRLRDLIDDGYITEPVTLPATSIDLSEVRKVAGEYSQSGGGGVFLETTATAEIWQAAKDKGCKSVLIFATGVAHAELIRQELLTLGEQASVITGETVPLIRESVISSFSNRRIKWLINVNCLTTGFDAPCIDMVAIARATTSAGLFLQMVGRGFRLYDDKKQCWIMDFGGNIDRFGPIDSPSYGEDAIKTTNPKAGRVCPACFFENPKLSKVCLSCDKPFEKPAPAERQEVPDSLDLGSKPILSQPENFKVISCSYKRHVPKNAKELNKRDSLKATYCCVAEGDDETNLLGKRYFSEWVCIEHEGFARQKAEAWWRQRSQYEVPASIDEALEIIDGWYGIAETTMIEVRQDGKYNRISKAVVGPKPERENRELGEYDEEDLPF
jgi:DNA repair protein RadD